MSLQLHLKTCFIDFPASPSPVSNILRENIPRGELRNEEDKSGRFFTVDWEDEDKAWRGDAINQIAASMKKTHFSNLKNKMFHFISWFNITISTRWIRYLHFYEFFLFLCFFMTWDFFFVLLSRRQREIEMEKDGERIWVGNGRRKRVQSAGNFVLLAGI